MSKVTQENAEDVLSFHSPGISGLEKIADIRAAATALVLVVLEIERDTEGSIDPRDLEDDEREAVEKSSQDLIRVMMNSAPYCDDRSCACGKVISAANLAMESPVRKKFQEEPDNTNRFQRAVRLIREAMMTANAAVSLNGLV